MTNIIIRKSVQGEYKGVVCMGHAGFSKKGKDIVCASVSVLVINTLNSLDEFCNTPMIVRQNEETGFLNCEFRTFLNEKEILLMDSMVMGLEMISKQYGKKYCELKFEEV